VKKILLTTTALHQPWNEGDWDMSDDRRRLNSLDDIEFAVAHINELEAKLANLEKVVEALACTNVMQSKIDQTLAELKGQDDE
jgi:hypothetical protein